MTIEDMRNIVSQIDEFKKRAVMAIVDGGRVKIEQSTQKCSIEIFNPDNAALFDKSLAEPHCNKYNNRPKPKKTDITTTAKEEEDYVMVQESPLF